MYFHKDEELVYGSTENCPVVIECLTHKVKGYGDDNREAYEAMLRAEVRR